MAVDEKKSPEALIKTAGILWILVGLGIAVFQPPALSTEARLIVYIICGIGGSLHFAIADTAKYLGGSSHGR